MRIGFVTDEISPDVTEAVDIGVSWGIKDYEVRMIGANRIPDISEKEVQTILDLQKKYGIRITALSPGTFKGTLADQEQIRMELEKTLPETFRLAKLVGTQTIIVFGVQRSNADKPGDEERVVRIFRQVAELAQKEGMTIAVENEPGFWFDDGANTARLLEKVNSPALRANWDPANAVGTPEKPFPDGYNALKKWIVNVHVKDTVKGALLECVPIGEGVVDWPGQIATLLRDKPVEHITIETHCLPLIENSKRNLEVVRNLLKK